MDMPGRKFVRPFLLDQHREFYPLLHFVVLGSVDAQGDAWATVRAGEPGFLHSPDPSRSEEHTSELQSQSNLVCRLLLEKKKKQTQMRDVRSSRQYDDNTS